LRESALATKTTAEWVKILNDADVPAMAYNTLEQLFEDPHIRDVGLLREVQHPTEGKVYEIRPPNELSCGTRKDYLAAPKVGQQSVEVLGELGYDDKAIADMLKSGVTVDGRLKQ
jgi:crotonobetainyl-CoA:carnitine CoA-transferase CaiB-like acyl-CoA transferase